MAPFPDQDPLINRTGMKRHATPMHGHCQLSRRSTEAEWGLEDGMVRVKSPQNLGAAVVFIGLALIGLIFGRDLAFGSTAKMGPGFFPTILSLLVLGIGLLNVAKAFTITGEPIEKPHWRPITFICLAMMAFGFAVPYIGLAFSAALLTFLAAGARRDTRWGETVFLAFFLAIFSVLLFVYALGQSMPAWWGA